jgi:hypothetical protein
MKVVFWHKGYMTSQLYSQAALSSVKGFRYELSGSTIELQIPLEAAEKT